MNDIAKHRGLREMDAALGDGRTEDARRARLDLDDDERALLGQSLGQTEMHELYTGAHLS